MRRALLATLIIVLAVAAVLVGWNVWASPPGVPADPPTQVAVPVTAPVEAPPARAAQLPRHWLLAETPGLEDLAPAADAGEAGVEPRSFLQGRLVWESSGMPVVGARLQLTEMLLDTVLPTADARGAGLDGEYLLGEQVFSDRTGAFSLPAIETRHDPYLYIRHGAETCDVQKVRRQPAPGERGGCWQGEYRIAERGALRGRVVDEDGEPLNDVRVRGIDDPLFRHGELDEALREARIAGAEHFDPHGSVGSDLAPPWLRVRDRMLPFPASTTGGTGGFALGGLRPGSLQLILQGRDRIGRRTDFVVAAGQTTDVGDVVLRRGERFTVRLVDSAEEPVRGVRVAARPFGWDFGPGPKQTDGDGVAEFFLPGPEPPVNADDDDRDRASRRRRRQRVEPAVTVMIARSLDSPWEHMGEHPSPGVELTLPDVERREVLLVSIDGGRVEGATVRVTPRFPAFTAREVQPGRWLLGGILGRAEFVLVALAPGYAPAIVANRWDGPLYMVPAFSTTLRATDAYGRPVAGARVRAEVYDSPLYNHCGSSWRLLGRSMPTLGFTDETGTVVVDGMWRTYMRFLVDHPEHGEEKTRVIIPEPGQPIWVRLVRRAGVKGFVDATAVGAAGRRWRVVAVWQHEDRLEREKYEPRSTLTAEDGSYTLPDLHEGRWNLRVTEPLAADGRFVGPDSARRLRDVGRFSYASAEIVAVPGETIYVDLKLGRPDADDAPDVRGRITLSGAGHPGLRVRLRGGRTQSSARARSGAMRSLERFRVELTETTDDYGRFRFDGLQQPGEASPRFGARSVWPNDAELCVQLRHDGEWVTLAMRELDLSEAGRPGRDPVEVAIDIPVGAIQLGVFDHRGQAMKGRMFLVEHLPDDSGGKERGGPEAPDRGDAGFAVTLVADETGTIRFDLLPAGRYRVSVRADSADRPVLRDAEVRVTAGETVFRDLHAVDPVDLGEAPASAKR